MLTTVIIIIIIIIIIILTSTVFVSFCVMLYTSKPILHCHVLERCIIVFS